MLAQKTNNSVIMKIIGTIIIITGAGMIPAWIWAEFAEETRSAMAFRLCVPATLAVGIFISFYFRTHQSRFEKDSTGFGARHGYIVVALSWFIASFIGAFPYYMSNPELGFMTAFFESTAGFTTTGCGNMDSNLLSHSLILWKAIANWLGGMGILVFVISILPALGISGQFIVRAEAPGPVYQKTTVRMKNSARSLYVTYALITIIEFFMLLPCKKLNLFDCIILTLGSVSTGGVTFHDGGIGYYDSIYVELVVISVCLLASINFNMYYYLIKGRLLEIFEDIELCAFAAIITIATIICTLSLMFNSDMPFAGSLREGFFQVSNIVSTSGYTRNPDIVWPSTCLVILIAIMIIGGCSASTAGSLKVVRLLVLIKLVLRGCTRRIHPRSVVAVKLNGQAIPADVVSRITVFIMAFVGIILLSGLVLSIQGCDLETSISTSIALFSNTGTAFTAAGASSSFDAFSPALKLYMSILMITGRLEIFPILMFFTPGFWGKKA